MKMKKKKKSRLRHSGSHPDEAYEVGTEKNLYLDQPSTHGGWPEGEYDPPVNKQILSWMRKMKLVENRLKERIKNIIREDF